MLPGGSAALEAAVFAGGAPPDPRARTPSLDPSLALPSFDPLLFVRAHSREELLAARSGLVRRYADLKGPARSASVGTLDALVLSTGQLASTDTLLARRAEAGRAVLRELAGQRVAAAGIQADLRGRAARLRNLYVERAYIVRLCLELEAVRRWEARAAAVSECLAKGLEGGAAGFSQAVSECASLLEEVCASVERPLRDSGVEFPALNLGGEPPEALIEARKQRLLSSLLAVATPLFTSLLRIREPLAQLFACVSLVSPDRTVDLIRQVFTAPLVSKILASRQQPDCAAVGGAVALLSRGLSGMRAASDPNWLNILDSLGSEAGVAKWLGGLGGTGGLKSPEGPGGRETRESQDSQDSRERPWPVRVPPSFSAEILKGAVLEPFCASLVEKFPIFCSPVCYTNIVYVYLLVGRLCSEFGVSCFRSLPRILLLPTSVRDFGRYLQETVVSHIAGAWPNPQGVVDVSYLLKHVLKLYTQPPTAVEENVRANSPGSLFLPVVAPDLLESVERMFEALGAFFAEQARPRGAGDGPVDGPVDARAAGHGGAQRDLRSGEASADFAGAAGSAVATSGAAAAAAGRATSLPVTPTAAAEPPQQASHPPKRLSFMANLFGSKKDLPKSRAGQAAPSVPCASSGSSASATPSARPVQPAHLAQPSESDRQDKPPAASFALPGQALTKQASEFCHAFVEALRELLVDLHSSCTRAYAGAEEGLAEFDLVYDKGFDVVGLAREARDIYREYMRRLGASLAHQGVSLLAKIAEMSGHKDCDRFAYWANYESAEKIIEELAARE